MDAYKVSIRTLSALVWKLRWQASTSITLRLTRRSRMLRLGMHTDGKLKKAPTESRDSFLRTSGTMVILWWLTLRLIFANTFLSEDYYFPDAGMEHCDAWAALSWVFGFLQEFNIWGCFGCLTVSHSFHLPPRTCRWLWLLLVFWLCLVFPVFCKCLGGVLFIPPRVLDDRQCFTARSAKQKNIRRSERRDHACQMCQIFKSMVNA